MDIREKSKVSQSNDKEVSEQEINDSLIFNIMKKIQLRQQLIEEYQKQKQQTNKHWLTKYYLHGNVPLYYGSGILLTKIAKIIYMKPGASANTVMSIPNLLFHVCVLVSLNEYYKYRNIFYLKHEMGEEYRIYQRNVDNLMEQKMAQFSLSKKLSQNNFFNQDHLMQTLKYRIVV